MKAGMPELLAPAGHWPAMEAAAANGADAVYFGVDGFNARMRAANFQRSELPAIADWLHRRGIKAYLTLNVLVFPAELQEAAELVCAAAAAGIDALIVQDIGVALLARELAPELAIHASTQMSITSTAGVAQAAALGCRQVVLARELSLKDFGRIQSQLRDRHLAMPLEVFVHGALCVAYSGQCLTSEALGQRSANRGECAQACRLPYQLIVDGQERDLGEQRYLLSPQDLAAWELLPQLADQGIASLKIEGRLKEATYVAAVTQAYRQTLDRLEGANMDTSAPPHDEIQAAEEQRRSLELAFSRGLSSGWLEGVDHRRLVHGRWSKKRGPQIGRLEAIEPGGWWLLRSREQLKPGDGLVLEGPALSPLEPPVEVGGRVMAVERRAPDLLALRLGPGRIDGRPLRTGSPCWLTSDPALERRWQRQAAAAAPELAAGLELLVRGTLGEPLEIKLLAADGLERAGLADPPLAADSGAELACRSAMPLAMASGAGLDRARLETQLGRLGGTGWQLRCLQLDLPPGLFLPVAELNRMRRALVHQLDERVRQARPVQRPVRSEPVAYAQVSASLLPKERPPAPAQPQLHVLVRSLEQLRALRSLPLASVTADLEQPRELREAVALGQGCWRHGIWLTGARITRPDEAWSLEPLIQARPDGYLVRNADQLERLTPLAPCVGDFSLNVANPLTAGWFLDHWGLQRITASYDLDLQQLSALAAGVPAAALEVTVHQHMPLFHMEHCLFCAFLSEGHDHTDCGRPCERHQVLLRDRSGSEHPLRADLGCRNTLFNGRAQTAAEALPQLLEAGIRHLRVELLDESGEAAERRVRAYLDLLAGRRSGQDLWRSEQLESRLGVTRGSLKAPRQRAVSSNSG
jgi:U32 family peptidase